VGLKMAKKKSPTKKTPTKKAPAKKATTKKAPAKKAPAKKAPAKKAPTKKPPAKKAPAKKKSDEKASAKESSVKKPLDRMSEEELKKLTIAQLKELCKEKGYKVLSRYNKEDIIILILAGGKTMKAPAKKKPRTKKPAKKKDAGTIKQGTIASFMRKRTQLVGFEYGYNKHTQYCAEFTDNALDAIESFQWKNLKKESPIIFTLDQELDLINLGNAFLQKEDKPEVKKPPILNEDAKHSLMQEFGIEPIEAKEEIEVSTEEEIKDEVIDKDQIEVEEEVKAIINEMEETIGPVESNVDIDKEPIVIMRIKEHVPPAYLTAELSQKNVMMYSFEIFDNGTGMNEADLSKYGKYLASSKSMELKQTRGSQGFGSPSAFSDAQNTTGRPIVAISKSADNIYATVSEFFTTSKNLKKYVVAPTEIDTPFLHGTYVKLYYLNVKYVRGYADNYIKETALMNPHITIVFLDPYNEQFIYPRKVSSFPLEPKYAKPHPSSTNIGDLQDLLTKSENLSVSAFLKENFVRVSSKTAKDIINLAERDLQDKLGLLILKNGYLTKAEKKGDDIYFLRFEKRVFGKSVKPRDKLIIYKLTAEEILNKYWDSILKYNKFVKNRVKISKEIKKLNNRIEKSGTKKEIKALEKDIREFTKQINEIRKDKDKVRQELDANFKETGEGLVEQKKFKDRTDFEDLVNEVQISKSRPINLTSEQFNSLFLAFKSVKYMAPPTDTAIPVGDTVLENTLIKELGLQISENLDDFDTPVEEVDKTSNQLLIKKRNELLKEDISVSKEILDSITVDQEEIINISSQILTSIDVSDEISQDGGLKESVDMILNYGEIKPVDVYSDVFDYFIDTFTKDDDFVAAETRNPTSGKGLAYVVEAVMAYSKKLSEPKRSFDLLSRFVNRTPKLRDSADCAITKAVSSVNWKNYKLNTFDNGIPKGPIRLLVNVSGPYVHLMFKSQSKNSLAADEDLNKEIKACLEAVGRRVRVYINRQQKMRTSAKRASKIEKYIPAFVKSIYNIAYQGESIHKARLNKKELEDLMREALRLTIAPKSKPSEAKEVEVLVKTEEITEDVTKAEAITEDVTKAEEIKRVEIREAVVEKPPIVKPVVEAAKSTRIDYSEATLKNYNKETLIELCKKDNIRVLSKDTKSAIISKILDFQRKPLEVIPVVEKPPVPVAPGTIAAKTAQLRASRGKAPTPPTPKKTAPPPKPAPPKPTKQTTLPLITTEKILGALSNELQDIRGLIFNLKIKDMMDARFLQIKLKDLERRGQVVVDIKMGKKHWKLK
jgi:DNA topoisomerase VI B subunit